jgi:hypothetical protein
LKEMREMMAEELLRVDAQAPKEVDIQAALLE